MATFSSVHDITDHTGIPGVGAGGGGELDYVEFTSPVSITATTEATANTIVTGGSVAYDGSTVVMIEAFVPEASTTAANAILVFVLYDGSSAIGQLGIMASDASDDWRWPTMLRRRLTPSAASHTYSLRGYRAGVNWTITAGAGGAATRVPGYIRITTA